MYGRLKISHHKHSGRLRPHEHTSYFPLALLVLVVGLLLGSCSVSTVAGESPGPQAGSIGLTGTVPRAAPKTGAVITSPSAQQHFTTSPITISGTCPVNTVVELFKNDIFAGAGTCTNKGTFSFKIDLLIGENKLVARVYDVLNQAGPDSAPVIVYYDTTAASSSALGLLNFNDAQLILNTDAIYRGIFPEQQLSVPISIIGGTPPYALNVQWGDSDNNVIARNNNSTFNANHVYHKPGTYQITLQANSSQGRVAFLTVAAIVNGQPASTPVGNISKTPVNKLLVLWPMYAILVTLVVSFWLGERRERRILSHNSGPVYHAG